MKKNLRPFVLLVLGCVMSAFTVSKPIVASSKNPATILPSSHAASMLTSMLSSHNIRERGRLKNVEDSGYPMVTLTIEFPERHFTETFIMNLEEVPNMTFAKLSRWKNRYVSFNYNSELSNVLLDIRRNGKSIFEDSEFTETDETKTVEGILSGAAEATAGDLPDEIYIKTEEEITVAFDFFITSEVVAMNGKKVVGYYEERTQNTITSIRLLSR